MHDLPKFSRLAATALLTATAGLATASAAQADSIAYIKGGDVWVAKPDGTQQTRMTYDGGYSSVSQSDLGHYAALHGDHIRTLNHDGTVMSDIATPVSTGMPGTQFRGPFDPAISPDGMKIAYAYYYEYTGYDPYCNPSTNCYTHEIYQGTGFTRTDKLTGWDELGFKRQSGWVGASWTGDGEVMLSDPSQPLNEDVVLYTPGDESTQLPGGLSRWFSDSGADGLRDGEMTREKGMMAFVAGGDDKSIRLYRNVGYPNAPEPCYQLTGGTGAYSSPSWSPDGSQLAFADDSGIREIKIPGTKASCGTPTEDDRLVIAGAKSPDWGPADVPPAPKAPGGDDKPTPSPAPTPKPTDPATPTTTKATLKVSARKLRAALARGLTISVSNAKPGSATLKAKAGSKLVAIGKLTVKADGKGKATLRFTKAAKRSLKRKAKVTLKITGAGATRKVTLKR